MDLEEFIKGLDESGSPQILYHYTDIMGFVGVLYSKKINGSIFWTTITNKKSIATTRFKLDKSKIDDININEKNNIGRFVLHYHKINDYIRNIKKDLISEIYIEKNRRLQQLKKVENKNKDINDEIKKYEKLVKRSVIEREAEERIIADAIPLEYKNYVIKFEFIDYPNLDLLHKKSNNRLYELIKEEKFFIKNKYYKWVKSNIKLIV